MLLQEAPRTPLELSELNASYMTLIGGSLNNSKLFTESQNFYFPKGFCQNVGDLFIFTDMMDPYSSPLHHISNIMVYDINMVGAIMEYGILSQTNPTWFSQRITVLSNVNPNNSLKSFRNQTASQEAMLGAIYSALPVLKDTDFCLLLIQDIEVDPKEKQHPEVLFTVLHISCPVNIYVSK